MSTWAWPKKNACPESEATNDIVRLMSLFTRRHYRAGHALRAGNTKTYGVVRGEFTVLPDLPDDLGPGGEYSANRRPTLHR